MKILLTILLFLIPFLLFAEEEPFWEYVGGPNGGRCWEIHHNSSNNDLYAVTTNGIYRSLDYGESWELMYFDSEETIYDPYYTMNSSGTIFGYKKKR